MTAVLAAAAPDIPALTWRAASMVLSLLQPMLWTVLAIAFVLASVHLISMLATRWGDRRVSGKSLGFSAGLHLMVLVGVLSMLPSVRPRWRTNAAPEDPAVTVRTAASSDPRSTTSNDQGNRPVWEQIESTPELALARMSRVMEDVAEPTIRERTRPADRPIELARNEPLPIAPAERPRTAAEARPSGPTARAETSLPEPAAAAESRAEPTPVTGPQRRQAADGEQDLPTVARADRRQRAAAGGSFEPSARLRSLPATPTERADIVRGEDSKIARNAAPAGRRMPAEAVASAAEAASEVTGPKQTRNRSMRRPPPQADDTPVRCRTPARPTANDVASRPAGSLLDFGPDVPDEADSPQFAAANTDALKTSNRSRLPAEYRLRTRDGRQESAERFGGTEESERAVAKALRYLANAQSADGSWDADRFGAGRGNEANLEEDRPNVGQECDSGVTALAVLAYLGSGSTPAAGEYRQQVSRALTYLAEQQKPNGYLGGRSVDPIAGAYSHAIATFAMAEASAMMRDDVRGRAPQSDGLRGPLDRAVRYTLTAQLEDGGWRYVPRQPKGGDISIFGWQLMSLKSARIAGVDVPDRTIEEMTQFLADRSRGRDGGLAGYRAADPPSPAMTAEALFCKQMLGLKRSDAASLEAVEYLLSRPPRLAEENFYYWYYGTLAMFQYGGEPWEAWNERVRDLLVAEQRPDGSWSPRGPWGAYGGSVYSTALATLSLEVYYRYLPLYKDGGQYDP